MLDQLPAWLLAEVEQLPAAEIVTPVVAVPGRGCGGRWEPIRYTVEGTDDQGNVVYLRSHGADFNIMPPALLRTGVRTIASLGPGLDENTEQRWVLLVQCFTHNDKLITRLADRLTTSGAAVEVGVRTIYGQRCWLLSAVLPQGAAEASSSD